MTSFALPSETASTSLLTLRGVGLRFGRSEVLRDIELDVAGGAFVAVVGPDGAGKSTLLRVLAGLRQPSSGTITRSVPKEHVGYSGSEFDLYGDLTIMENLRFFARVRGMAHKKFRPAAERMLKMVGLTDAAHVLAATLSGGMKKKLALAAALIHEPRLLLLDEPTVGVDPASRRELWGIIAQACAGGTAVVFATTYLDEAERAQRIVHLCAGEAFDVSPQRMAASVQGWEAWVLVEGIARNVIRVGLARAHLGPRAYLRQEGLTLLAPDLKEAEGMANQVLSHLPGHCTPRRASAPIALTATSLNLDDLFVLIQTGLAERFEGNL